MNDMDSEKLSLKNLVYWGYVGASEWERRTLTRIEVDIEIRADLGKACKSDDLGDTIDYSRLREIAGKIVGAKHHNLLESLAEEIADGAFKLCKCEMVTLRVRKPQPPIGGPCDFAEIELVRHRTGRS
jgi:dihydroneopterin aldolase